MNWKVYALLFYCLVAVVSIRFLLSSNESQRELYRQETTTVKQGYNYLRKSNSSGHSDLILTDTELPTNTTNTTNLFQYPVQSNATAHTARRLPIPMQVMEDYIRQHSVQALRDDPHPERRKYAIAYYQCPARAGNNLHRFFNHVLWAILTNRTVLYQYWSKDVCNKYGLSACAGVNKESDCANILDRAPWIASYDEWKDRIIGPGENVDEPFLVPYHATIERIVEWDRFPLPPNYQDDFGVDLPDKYPYRVVMFPLCYQKFWQLGETWLQHTLLKTETARETAVKLFWLDADFLYGMLYRYTFQFSETVRSTLPATLARDNRKYFTIGLHSRHVADSQDGCNIDREISCLEEVIQQRGSAKTPVQVRIMSDRVCTISQLTEWLQARNHSVMIATHEKVAFDNRKEHGPYAGIGYFEDLAIVSTARNAIIAMARTSSDLMRELITFNRALELWEQGASVSRMEHPVYTCKIPYKSPQLLALEATE